MDVEGTEVPRERFSTVKRISAIYPENAEDKDEQNWSDSEKVVFANELSFTTMSAARAYSRDFSKSPLCTAISNALMKSLRHCLGVLLDVFCGKNIKCR